MRTSTTPGVESIVQLVRGEFGEKAGLFEPVVLRMDALERMDSQAARAPGVYVFMHDDKGCIKVGKSQSDALKRALQHCGSDNTTSKDGSIQMLHLRHCSKTSLLIFTLRKHDSMHWILALEHYLEMTLNPRITSRRSG